MSSGSLVNTIAPWAKGDGQHEGVNDVAGTRSTAQHAGCLRQFEPDGHHFAAVEELAELDLATRVAPCLADNRRWYQ
jgi:hypothetical protein